MSELDYLEEISAASQPVVQHLRPIAVVLRLLRQQATAAAVVAPRP